LNSNIIFHYGHLIQIRNVLFLTVRCVCVVRIGVLLLPAAGIRVYIYILHALILLFFKSSGCVFGAWRASLLGSHVCVLYIAGVADGRGLTTHTHTETDRVILIGRQRVFPALLTSSHSGRYQQTLGRVRTLDSTRFVWSECVRAEPYTHTHTHTVLVTLRLYCG